MNVVCGRIRPSTTYTTLNLLLLFIIVLSYLPQYHRIISRQSSYGISPCAILLQNIFSTANLAKSLLSVRFDLIECYRSGELPPDYAFKALSGIWSFAAQWVCSVVILVLYLIYHRRSPLPFSAPSSSPSSSSPEIRHDQPSLVAANLSNSWSRNAYIVLITSFVFTLIILFPSLWFTFTPLPRMDIGIGVLLGLCWIALTILSITTVLLQYVPQIFMTWKLQRVESLSILTTALQVPVFGAMAASWAVTVGIVGARGGTQGVYLGIGSTWMDWVLTAVGSGLLLSVCIYLEYVRGMRESDFIGVECEDRESGGGGEIEELEVAGRADERTQLLGE